MTFWLSPSTKALASSELILTPSFGVMLLMIYWRRRSFRSHSISFLSFRAQREISDPSRSLGMTTDVWHIATDAFEYSGLGPIVIVDKAAVIDAAQIMEIP